LSHSSMPLSRCCRVMLVFGLVAAAPWSLADEVDELRALAAGGAPQLVAVLIEQRQPDAAERTEVWAEWERLRIELLALQEDWGGVRARLEKHPPHLPAEFRRWAGEQQVRAHLALGEGEPARDRLHALIWDAEAPPSPEQLARWRHLLIQAYLAEDRVAEARAALLRYRQDYGDPAEDWSIPLARALLRAGDPEAAERVLREASEPHARVLAGLARLRAGLDGPEQTLRELEALLGGGEADLEPATRAEAWAVAAEAVRRFSDPRLRASVLEQALQHPVPEHHEDLTPVTAEGLWDTYVALGRAEGNQRQLLIGQDERWQEAAREAAEHDPLAARALLAALAANGRDVQVRSAALERLGLRLVGDGLQALLVPLLLDAQQMAPEDVPPGLREPLAHQALASGRSDTARSLLAAANPPPGEDPHAWSLRRARLLLAAGEIEEGVQALRGLLEGELSGEALFDLMGAAAELSLVGAHRYAADLYEALLVRASDGETQQALLYALAADWEAAGAPEHAGYAYLRLARALAPGDAESAEAVLLQAADALHRAGLTEDARRMYAHILGRTQDAARRAWVERRLTGGSGVEAATPTDAGPLARGFGAGS
jgi:hypothetical protein